MTWKKFVGKNVEGQCSFRFFYFLPVLIIIVALAAPVRALDSPAGAKQGPPGSMARLADLPPEIREKVVRHLETAELEVQWQAETPLPGGPGAYRAANLRRGLTAYFNEKGLFLIPAGLGEPAWRLEMALLGAGRDGGLDPAATGKIEASNDRIEHRRGGLTEWYVNRPEGLEQGLTLMHRPEGSGSLRIEWAVSAGMNPRLEKDGLSAVFEREGHGPVLRYSGLKAWDATGRSLTARLAVHGGHDGGSPIRLAWVVDDAGAVYPVTVDPAFSEVKKITASDGGASDWFGQSVAVSGDMVVVGSTQADIGGNTNQGAAWVFYRNQGGTDNWGWVIKLTASDGAASDWFGYSVSVNGDTIVTGARSCQVGANNEQGATYVFYRNNGGADNWGEVKKLTSSDGAANDLFGISVSVSGDTVVAGALGCDVGGNADQGAGYVFDRDRGGADNWGEVEKLTASDGAANDNLGISLGISGDTVVLGAYMARVGLNPAQGAAYVYYRNQGGADNWGEVQKLVAVDGATGDMFGGSLSVNADTVLGGALGSDVDGMNNRGAAYVFDRNQGGADNWGQVKKLVSADGAAGDNFGQSVSLDGDTAVVAAGGCEVGGNVDQGAAYVFFTPTPPGPAPPGGGFNLTVQKEGTGTGTVTSSPAGIECGANCNLACNDGDCYTLTGAPADGSAFDGWAGADCPGNGACPVNMDQDLVVTATFNKDTDADGVSDVIENAGPNGGDANQDGVPDSEQAEVATFQSVNGGWCTLLAEGGTVLKQVTYTVNPSPADAPAGAAFPAGFLGFNVEGLTPGGSTTVALVLHDQDTTLSNYYRYGPTPDNNADHWYDFSYAGGTGAVVTHPQSQTLVGMTFIDGGRGDDDLTADGVIVDLGGPGNAGDSPGGGGGSGSCFISTTNP